MRKITAIFFGSMLLCAHCGSSESDSKGGSVGGGSGLGSGGSVSGAGGSASGGAGGTAGTGGEPGEGGASGASGTSGEGGASGEGGDPGDCPLFEDLAECISIVESVSTAAHAMLVVDKSGSMSLPGGSGARWDELKETLAVTLNAAEGVSFGLILYPFSTTTPIPLMGCLNCCEVPEGSAAVSVPIASGLTNAAEIMAALDDTSPGGGTPTGAGFERAYDYFSSPAGMALAGRRYAILVTDGGPNCNAAITCEAETCTVNMDDPDLTVNACEGDQGTPPPSAFCLDDANVLAQIDALLSIGVPTFVVGMPGTEQYASYLDTFAVAGGVPRSPTPPLYYDASAAGGAEALADALGVITTGIDSSCELQLGSAPANINLVNVAIDCQIIPANSSGWMPSPDDETKLLLVGAACDSVENQGVERVDVIHGCPTIL